MGDKSPSDTVRRGNLRIRLFITVCYKVTITVVAAAVLWGASALLCALQSCSVGFVRWGAAAVYFTALLFVAAWLFSLFSVWLRRPIVAIICSSILFVWGSMSYFMWHVDSDAAFAASDVEADGVRLETLSSAGMSIYERQLEAPNRALSAFFPSRGGFERLDRRYLLHYFLFHLVVLTFVGALMFSHFGRGIVNRFRKRFLIPERFLNVFWGVEDVDFLLSRDLLEATIDQQVAFMLSDSLRFNIEKFRAAVYRLDLMDAAWVLSDISRPRKSDVRGHRHFFLHESGHRNVSNANRLVEIMSEFGVNRPEKTFLYVRVESGEEEQVFFEWANSACVKKTVTPIIIRESDMIAGQFIEAHSMLDCPGIAVDDETAKVSGSFRVLLLGLGAVGQSVLREMVANGQFVGQSGFSVDVIESDAAVVESFRAQHGEAVAEYGINLVDGVRAEGPGFEEFLAKNLMSYNRIVVCLAGDVMNIRVANRIARYVTEDGERIRDGVLFIRVSDSNRRSYFNPGTSMTLFGDLREVYSLRTLDYDPIDTMAKTLNGEWAKDKSAAGIERAWMDASFSDKRSSRASAIGERTLARLIGLEIVPLSDERKGLSKEEFEGLLRKSVGDGTVEERLARNEHLRWNAYHRMLGYSCWDMKTPPLAKVSAKRANQLADFGKHACLVDFDELPQVDYELACALQAVNREKSNSDDFVGVVHVDVNGDGKPRASFQAYDYMFVRKIWDNANASGMKLVRRGISNSQRENSVVMHHLG